MAPSEMFIGAGIAGLLAAMVGGGLKAFGVELPAIASPRRQAALGLVGFVLILVGLSLGKETGDEPPPLSREKRIERAFVVKTGSFDEWMGAKFDLRNVRLYPDREVASLVVKQPRTDGVVHCLSVGDELALEIPGCSEIKMLVKSVIPDAVDRMARESALKAGSMMMLMGSGTVSFKLIGFCEPDRLPTTA